MISGAFLHTSAEAGVHSNLQTPDRVWTPALAGAHNEVCL